MSKIRHLYYKDLAGFRFIGMLFIFFYITVYLMAANENSEFSLSMLVYSNEFKDVGLSIFVLLSSFLITVQGLREYKYKKEFALRKFYIRRLLKISPILIIALIFYFAIHPLMINFLKLTPLEGSNNVQNLFFFPTNNNLLRVEVFIYASVIYSIFMFCLLYFFWGIILKYLSKYLGLIAIIMILGGIVLKFFSLQESSAFQHYLYYFIFEIGIGATLAIIFRKKEKVLDYVKKTSNSQIITFYILVALLGGIWLLTLKFQLVSVFIKILFTIVIACMIMEQTFSKHSVFKFRNIKIIIRMGKISYNMIVLMPIIAVIILISLESLDRSMGSPIIKIMYPLITFFVTWILSDIFYKYISKFFIRMQADFKPLK